MASVASNNPGPLQRKRKLALVKCERCRLDKQKCLPVDRTWPTKCDRCIEKDFPCSEGRRVKRTTKHHATPNIGTLSHPNPKDQTNHSNFQRKMREWTELVSYRKIMVMAMENFLFLKKRILDPFLDGDLEPSHFDRCIAGGDFLQFPEFYFKLDAKLHELKTELIATKSCADDLGSELLSQLMAQAIPLFSWKYKCRICSNVGGEESRQDLNQLGDSCGTYLLRLNHLTNHVNERKSWTSGTVDLLKWEIEALSKISLKVHSTAEVMLKAVGLYDSLPSISQINLSFRLDGINYVSYLEDCAHWDCLGRSGLLQAFDACTEDSARELDVAHLSLFCPPDDTNKQDILGRTPLHLACEQNSTVAVQKLLSKGADPALKTVYGSLPLHFAAAKGSLSICKLLLTEPLLGYNVNQTDCQQNTALYYAINSKNKDLVDFLLTEPHKMDPKTGSNHSIIIKTLHEDSEDLLRMLLKRGLDPSILAPWRPHLSVRTVQLIDQIDQIRHRRKISTSILLLSFGLPEPGSESLTWAIPDADFDKYSSPAASTSGTTYAGMDYTDPALLSFYA